MSLMDSVDKVYMGSSFTWPDDLVRLYPSLLCISIPFTANDMDVVQWREGNVLSDFSTSLAWDAIRVKEGKVDWADCVWFPQCISKHAFNMWLICHAWLALVVKSKKKGGVKKKKR
ncbi:hypothetical protein QVD17_30511 [Tagetes erecta]|uniref:Reverse transcriptase zinc-binding domain-containing protein n=1 Tax=Tagetes erecta TaxID=13708 RepID=A0AAD8K4A9_TARER|nr:hypothetical protein QVD17_30511 [Tagetes erecta]